MKLESVGMFKGTTQVLRKTLTLQPGFYYPTVHMTKTFNKLKFSLCKWATVLNPCYNLSAWVPSLPMSLSRSKTPAKTKQLPTACRKAHRSQLFQHAP